MTSEDRKAIRAKAQQAIERYSQFASGNLMAPQCIQLCDRIEALEKALEDALDLYMQDDHPSTYERYRAACAVLEGK